MIYLIHHGSGAKFKEIGSISTLSFYPILDGGEKEDSS